MVIICSVVIVVMVIMCSVVSEVMLIINSVVIIVMITYNLSKAVSNPDMCYFATVDLLNR